MLCYCTAVGSFTFGFSTAALILAIVGSSQYKLGQLNTANEIFKYVKGIMILDIVIWAVSFRAVVLGLTYYVIALLS